ncbi:hypothetical protein [Deminuibacter soli]|uniref:Uncharacterized protein n=1 Tax=Deminuibacter soli TaxID=2291815 RepID=A0A3E1NQ76_9BACT|nr:hypothetical protein [Deminuibacter soli]RFM30057.1 hypothetical protein DXN05_03535 [Deminuibacter soli]
MGKKTTKIQIAPPVDEQGVEVVKSPIQIMSAALKDEFCNYTYDHLVAPNTTNTVNIKSSVLVHDDLKKAFARLNVHLAVICEEIDPLDVLDIEDIAEYDSSMHNEESMEFKVSRFTVTSFKIDGTGENEGVTLAGHKRLKTGDYLKLDTPKTKWINDYPFINELRVVIDDLRAEVDKYMHGKAAPRWIQPELDMPEDGQEEDLSLAI